MELAEIEKALVDPRNRKSLDSEQRDAPGIYAIFLKNGIEFPTPLYPGKWKLEVPESGLLYLGISKDSLSRRAHYRYSYSSQSTLRRTLGAILKEHLNLRALSRSSGNKAVESSNYRFDDQGEFSLKSWMLKHIEISSCEVDSRRCGDFERDLLSRHRPPLNIVRNGQNPHLQDLKRARKECREEAKRSRK